VDEGDDDLTLPRRSGTLDENVVPIDDVLVAHRIASHLESEDIFGANDIPQRDRFDILRGFHWQSRCDSARKRQSIAGSVSSTWRQDIDGTAAVVHPIQQALLLEICDVLMHGGKAFQPHCPGDLFKGGGISISGHERSEKVDDLFLPSRNGHVRIIAKKKRNASGHFLHFLHRCTSRVNERPGVNLSVDPRSLADEVIRGEGMISLKRYLDQDIRQMASRQSESSGCETLLNAYRTGLLEMGDCGVNACPDLAPELARGLKRIIETLEQSPTADTITASEYAVRDLLRSWGRQVASHYDQKATDVRDLLLVMSRTTESLGNKDDRVAQRIDRVAEQLRSIVSLNDVSRMRASVEASALELRDSLNKMNAEGKALIGHLRAEVSTYQAKLEKAERLSCSDALTGLGSRHWVESRIQERIGCGARFSIALIDIAGFHHVVESYGNLTGDLLLKEFAKELRSACRFTDIVGRWGSDEFIIVLDGAGPESEPQVARLRASISKSYHVPGRTGYVSVPLAVSVGMAEHRLGEDVLEILERADEELCRGRSEKLRQRTA